MGKGYLAQGNPVIKNHDVHAHRSSHPVHGAMKSASKASPKTEAHESKKVEKAEKD